MQVRAQALREHKLTLENVYEKLTCLEPLPGANDFLTWLKPIVPRSFMISDSFEEFAMPIFQKLGHPMVFCNFLVIAIGSSYLDVPMIKTAEAGILFKPSQHITDAHPEIATAMNYEELKIRILEIIADRP